MAKQSGVHKLRGKIGGLSYYESRNGGSLVRDINDGMSSRVKTAPEFANTRLNATEFGGAGKLAGAIIRPVSQRWRYILSAIGTGTMAALIKESMSTDTQNPWGERIVPLTAMNGIQAAYNTLSKNQLPQELSDLMARSFYDSDTTKINVGNGVGCDFSEDTANFLLSQGVEGVITRIFQFNVGNISFNPASGKYTRNVAGDCLFPLDSQDAEVAAGNTLFPNDIYDPAPAGLLGSGIKVPQNAANHFGGILVVMLPYKVVSNQKYILQELCAASWMNLPDAPEE